jgi:hypothetical protein
MGGSAAAAPVDWKGTDRYEVLGCLGQGGMGVVYEAFDRERRQLVALKKLLQYDPAGLYLFKREFRTLADVRHTNLVHLYELVVGEGDDVYFTMELVRGTDFLQYVKKASPPVGSSPPGPLVTRRPPTWERETMRPRAVVEGTRRRSPLPRQAPADIDRLVPALRQLVEGVHALHSAGMLHRDVKPSNVLVTPEGRVVLLDFGVATELRGHAGEVAAGSGEVVGTARYMAPEQADDATPTPASDWYSVGIMLYEALVGHAPFVGSTIDVITMKNIMEVRRPSECVEGVPADLDTLCLALLEREPEARPDGIEILRRLGVTRSSAPPSQLGGGDARAAFIGRDRQLAVLREAFEASRAGKSVTVRVGGGSGMGKSTLVHHFLDGLAENSEALVLRGRAYEREAVPYKAVDTIVDALSRYLLRLVEAGERPPLPPDVWLLARLFPVLQRVPAIAELPAQPVADPHAVRRRAFAALRELLTLLGAKHPVVLFVDDAQWGDVDSAALLLDLLRPPSAPPLLLVMTYRDNEEQGSPLLTELRERWPAGADLREVQVEPLQLEAALQLALTLLEASDELAQRTARAVARESRGSPFLIEELVRSNRGAQSATGATLAVLTLDQMVAERLDRLPDPARRLIEIVAVGGRPLPVSVVAEASEAATSVNEVIGFLGARRFLRTGLRDGRDVVETIHDRIRETIVAQLPETKLRAHHDRLARALQDAPGADAEAVAIHWLGAGDTERAARFAEGAAEQAAAKVAFDQAIRLFRLTLEHTAGAPDRRRLQARIALLLRFSGRNEESARAFLAAAEGAPADLQLEFQRAAAGQLMSAGRIDQGKEILHRVLAAVGMSAPRTPLAAVFWLVVYRVWLGVIGLRYKTRAPGEVSAAARLRIDALATVSLGFSVVDVIVSACMQARHLIEALRAGDQFQLARAFSIEAGHLAAAGGRETRRERELTNGAKLLSEAEGSEEARSYYAGSVGVGLFNRGRWREARGLLKIANEAVYGHDGLETARIFEVYSLAFLGELNEARRRMARLCAQAEDRGDLYIPVNIQTSMSITMGLVIGEPERARAICDRALAQWTQDGFHVQHWQAMVYRPDIDVYQGEPVRAYETFMAQIPALKKSLLLHAGFIRTTTFFVRARLALSTLDARPEWKGAKVTEARAMARRLRREHDRWAGVCAHMVTAAVENTLGDRGAAVASLRAAIAEAESTDTALYGFASRLRLGQLLGGDEGSALFEAASAALREQGCADPVRWASIYLPGKWSASEPPSA